MFYSILRKVFSKKNPFLQDQLQNLLFVSAIFGHKFQNDLHRGQLLAVLCPSESIWHVCRVFRFLGYLVQKKFYLEKTQSIFKFFYSNLGSKKLSFVHTTKLASECLWKAHIWREKFILQRSGITTWRWLIVFSMWIATHFRSFLKFYINNFQHSTQLSSLIIPAKHHLNAIECSYCLFISTCIFDCFSWPFGPSETIYPKNSFTTTHNVDTLERFKTK